MLVEILGRFEEGKDLCEGELLVQEGWTNVWGQDGFFSQEGRATRRSESWWNHCS